MKNHTYTLNHNKTGFVSVLEFRSVARLGICSLLMLLFGASFVYAVESEFTAEKENAPWSVRLITGADFALSTDLDLKENGTTSKGDGDFNPGFVAGAALGYTWQESICLEFEYTYQTSGAGDADESVFGEGAESQIASVAIGPTLWYRPSNLFSGSLKPKIGLGIYWLEEVSLDIEQGGREDSFSDSGALYSITAGIDWEFRENWSLGTELRYYKSSSLDAEDETDSSRKLEFDYEGFNALVSLGYKF